MKKYTTKEILFKQDWDKICAHFSDFTNLQESSAWFWDTELEAMKDLCNNTIDKSWNYYKVWDYCAIIKDHYNNEKFIKIYSIEKIDWQLVYNEAYHDDELRVITHDERLHFFR